MTAFCKSWAQFEELLVILTELIIDLFTSVESRLKNNFNKSNHKRFYT